MSRTFKRSRVRVGRLKRLFPVEELQLSAMVARLCVLYEDLHIEIFAGADSIPPLDDVIEVEVRKRYFMRRSIATLHEFNEALRILDESADFQAIKNRFDKRSVVDWDRAVRFFRKFDGTLQNVRNDVGGHFGQTAAIHAVKSFGNETGTLKITEETSGSRKGRATVVNLPLASKVVAAAFFKHLPGKTATRQATAFRRRLVVGYRHALSCVHLLVVYHLADRFE